MDVDGGENNDEWEEEEQLVVVHLSGIIDNEYLKKCDASNCNVLGIDTETPVLQIDRMCFHGTYNESVGTNIIFEEQLTETANGEVSKNLKYKCHTTKNLDMVRVFLKSSSNTAPVSTMEKEDKSEETTATTSNTEEKGSATDLQLR